MPKAPRAKNEEKATREQLMIDPEFGVSVLGDGGALKAKSILSFSLNSGSTEEPEHEPPC